MSKAWNTLNLVFLKVAQVNYISRNQLHCTANLNLGLMYEKAKHCWALSTNFLFLFSWYFFLIIFCFLLNWRKNSNYFKIAVWRSDSMKRNFRGFIFTKNLLWGFPMAALMLTSLTDRMVCRCAWIRILLFSQNIGWANIAQPAHLIPPSLQRLLYWRSRCTNH